VKPPKRGVLEIVSQDFKRGVHKNCSSISTLIDANVKLENRIVSISEDLLNPALSDEDIKRLVARRKLLRQMADENETARQKISKKVGLVAKPIFETQWEEIRDEYRKLNPGFNVATLPVFGSILSIKTTDSDDILGSLDPESTIDGVHSVTIPGVKLGRLSDLEEIIGLTASDSNLSSDFIFGGSLVGSLQLNLDATCTMYEALGNLEHDFKIDDVNQALVREGIDARVVANLTSFYPVHVKKRLKISVTDKRLSEFVARFSKTKNTFSTREFMDEMANHDIDLGVKVELVNENPNQTKEDQALIEDMKLAVEDKLVQRVLDVVADKVPNSYKLVKLDVPNDPHIMVTNTRRICRTKRRWFKKKTHCWTESYKVKKKVDGHANATVNAVHKVIGKYNEVQEITSSIIKYTSIGFTK
jgi:hypothetical protein